MPCWFDDFIVYYVLLERWFNTFFKKIAWSSEREKVPHKVDASQDESATHQQRWRSAQVRQGLRCGHEAVSVSWGYQLKTTTTNSVLWFYFSFLTLQILLMRQRRTFLVCCGPSWWSTWSSRERKVRQPSMPRMRSSFGARTSARDTQMLPHLKTSPQASMMEWPFVLYFHSLFFKIPFKLTMYYIFK